MLKLAVKTGIICGLILIAPYIVQIIIGPDKYWINGIISLLLLALVIWLVVRSVKEFRAESDNKISFGNAFNISITSFLIVSIITVMFTFIHQNIIDPGYGQRTKDMIIQKAEESISENPNLTEDQKIMYMEKIEESDPSFSIQRVMKTMGFSIGLYLIISLIIAGSIKKDLNESPLT